MSDFIQHPAPQAPYGFSKYLKSLVDTITSRVNEYVVSNNAALAQEVSDRQSASQVAQTDRAAIRSELASEVADLSSNIATKAEEARVARENLSATVVADLNTERARIADLEAWKVANTDELSKEVDKAINEKVAQTTFDTIKAELQQKDSDITQNLADAITARTEKDAEHDAVLARMSKFVNILLSTYTLVDADGNAVNSFDDVVVSSA